MKLDEPLESKSGNIITEKGLPAGRLLTPADLMARFGVSRDWILKHSAGRGVLLPSLKVGKFRRFREADVDRFLEKCEAIASDAAMQTNGTGTRHMRREGKASRREDRDDQSRRPFTRKRYGD